MRRAAVIGLILAAVLGTTSCDDGSPGGWPPTSSTSSTTPGDLSTFWVSLGVTNDVGRLGALQFDARYLGDTGGWVGAAGWVLCETRVPNALATFNNKGGGLLSGAMINLDGLPTPGVMARCTFRTDEDLSPGSFEVDVVDSANIEGYPPKTQPVMAVIGIEPAP